jgi:hypothetical protein
MSALARLIETRLLEKCRNHVGPITPADVRTYAQAVHAELTAAMRDVDVTDSSPEDRAMTEPTSPENIDRLCAALDDWLDASLTECRRMISDPYGDPDGHDPARGRAGLALLPAYVEWFKTEARGGATPSNVTAGLFTALAAILAESCYVNQGANALRVAHMAGEVLGAMTERRLLAVLREKGQS